MNFWNLEHRISVVKNDIQTMHNTAHMHTHAHTPAHTHTHTNTHTPKQTHTHKDTHTHTHTHTHSPKLLIAVLSTIYSVIYHGFQLVKKTSTRVWCCECCTSLKHLEQFPSFLRETNNEMLWLNFIETQVEVEGTRIELISHIGFSISVSYVTVN